jgi:hypothetical protein
MRYIVKIEPGRWLNWKGGHAYSTTSKRDAYRYPLEVDAQTGLELIRIRSKRKNAFPYARIVGVEEVENGMSIVWRRAGIE